MKISELSEEVKNGIIVLPDFIQKFYVNSIDLDISKDLQQFSWIKIVNFLEILVNQFLSHLRFQ